MSAEVMRVLLAAHVDRLARAEQRLLELAQRPTNTLAEQHRLLAKREGVALALSYAREDLSAATQQGNA